MSWTNSGPSFQVVNALASNNGTVTGKSTSTGGFVSSKARHGTAKLPAGRYTLFVFAEGNWTIVIR